MSIRGICLIASSVISVLVATTLISCVRTWTDREIYRAVCVDERQC